MVTYKTKEEIIKDIEEHLTPWDQKELSGELVSKYLNINEYIDETSVDIDIDNIIDKYIEENDTDEILNKIDDDYGIAQYVANDKYLTEFMLDSYHNSAYNLIHSLKQSNLSLTEILEAVKDDEELYDELKNFIIKKCFD